MGRQKVHRTIHVRDVGKEARVRFGTGIGGMGTKCYVCGTGDRGTATKEMTGKMNRARVEIEQN